MAGFTVWPCFSPPTAGGAGASSKRVQQMKLNSKMTWGLAWAGLAVVVAVPSADFLTGQFGMKPNSAAVVTSTTEPVAPAVPAKAAAAQQTAEVTTKVTKDGVTIIPAGSRAPVLDPVDNYLKSGKKLPDYISDGSGSGDTVAAVPARTPAAPATTPEQPTQVANVEPAQQAVAPVPFPRRPPDVVKPALPKPAQSTQPTVVVDENALAARDEPMPDQLDVNGSAGPKPPAGIPDDWRRARQRSLTRYLETNGLIDEGPGSSASITVVERPSPEYDPDGFYLSDGPNNARAERKRRVQQLFDDGEENGSIVTWF